MRNRFPKVTCTGGFFPYLALLVLVLPLRVLGVLALAAGCHELCHLLALACFGYPVREISLGVFGAKIHTGPLKPIHEAICALAGPLGGLCLLAFARWMPLVALFGLIQSAFNLLPVYPLDGGRALLCLREGFSQK